MALYQVSMIDRNGDAIDVDAELTSIKAARDSASLAGEGDDVVASVIEKYTWVSRAGKFVNRDYVVIELCGDRAALKAGGWLDGINNIPIKPDPRKPAGVN